MSECVNILDMENLYPQDVKLDYNKEKTCLMVLENLFKNFASKDKRLYKQTYEVMKNIIKNMNEWLYPDVVNLILGVIKSAERGQREYCYKLLSILVKRGQKQLSSSLVKLIPVVTLDVNSSQKEVRDGAYKSLSLLLGCSGNVDLEPFIPVVLEALSEPKTINEGVEKLASCVFVQNVEAPALSIISPILVKGLNERKIETQRKCCVIIDNMCKLVEHPKEILEFSEKLRDLIKKCSENISDPEARVVADKALNTLNSSCQDVSLEEINKMFKTHTDILKIIETEIKLMDDSAIINVEDMELLSRIVRNMTYVQEFDELLWKDQFEVYMPSSLKNINVSSKICEELKKLFVLKEDVFEDTEEGIDLYKGSFSLAYGALTLLNNASLHLKRNRFYGLLGPNNCGKTTLMRAISNEQVEGFPKKDELKTIFVEHEIQEREVGEDENRFPILNIDLCGVDWVMDYCNEVCNLTPPVDRESVETVMEEIGFGNKKKGIGLDRAADAEMGVTTYSGGWKMKMQLCAATLMNADILMLDEPTGHLDTTNIAWIKGWLGNFIKNGGSIIATSHDSSFLNEMCTHLIDFQNRKLKTFRGESGTVLSDFVEKFPEKKGYFELKNDVVKFVFPEPTQLEGVKSMTKSILKMKNVTFTYPTRTEPTIKNVSLECSRASRVAVIGANGAGKSTAIKILTGELEAAEGEVIKHPNVRVAYIAQHAFQHLEKHLNKTPTEYILNRFAGNEDKENVEFLHKKKNEDEVVKKKYMVNPNDLSSLKECFGEDEEKRALEPEKILGRRENKKEKTYEYEVKFKEKSSDANLWVKKDILINMGVEALVQRQDEKEAVAAGLMSKPLTSVSVEKYLGTFSIEAEHASHTLIKSLSGGQKVKVVLAASLWQNPHLIILDEPTNYLDRDGLGALTLAIQNFKGGVIIISHNKEFANAVAEEKWIMEKGYLRKEGESVSKFEEEKNDENKLIGDDVMKDAYGNEIVINKKKQLSDKEKKTMIKKLQKKIKEGKKKGILTEEQIMDIEDEIEELKK